MIIQYLPQCTVSVILYILYVAHKLLVESALHDCLFIKGLLGMKKKVKVAIGVLLGLIFSTLFLAKIATAEESVSVLAFYEANETGHMQTNKAKSIFLENQHITLPFRDSIGTVIGKDNLALESYPLPSSAIVSARSECKPHDPDCIVKVLSRDYGLGPFIASRSPDIVMVFFAGTEPNGMECVQIPDSDSDPDISPSLPVNKYALEDKRSHSLLGNNATISYIYAPLLLPCIKNADNKDIENKSIRSRVYWAQIIGHELGHAFGLKHPTEDEDLYSYMSIYEGKLKKDDSFVAPYFTGKESEVIKTEFENMKVRSSEFRLNNRVLSDFTDAKKPVTKFNLSSATNPAEVFINPGFNKIELDYNCEVGIEFSVMATPKARELQGTQEVKTTTIRLFNTNQCKNSQLALGFHGSNGKIADYCLLVSHDLSNKACEQKDIEKYNVAVANKIVLGDVPRVLVKTTDENAESILIEYYSAPKMPACSDSTLKGVKEDRCRLKAFERNIGYGQNGTDFRIRYF